MYSLGIAYWIIFTRLLDSVGCGYRIFWGMSIANWIVLVVAIANWIVRVVAIGK